MLVAQTLREGLNATKEERVRTGATGPRAHASQAGDCIRKVAYGVLLGNREEWTPTLTQEVAFFMGRELEKAATIAAMMQNPTFQKQVPWVSLDGQLSGVADGTYEEDGELVCMEIKTMADSSFQWAKKMGKPRREHILQTGLSAVSLGATRIHLVYISKGAKQQEEPILEWVMETPVLEVMLAQDELKMAVEKAVAGRVPAPWWNGDIILAPMPKKSPCMWCPFQERCERDGPEEQEWDG